MSADDATTRPPKRARLSSEADSPSSLPYPSLAPSALSLTHPERHPELWFDDGNIILIAQQTGFRIFRGLLASQSTVFADMFASATSQADETLDGCPVVHLTDSHLDLAHLLRVLLPKSPLFCPTTNSEVTRSFDEVSAVVRLAHKYHIQSVQDQGIHALQERPCTSDFEVFCCPPKQRISVHGTECIGAVNLARLTDTPLMLPFTLYQCCYLGSNLLDGWTREDGTVEHLCMADIKRCFDGRIALGQEQCLLLPRLFEPIPPGKCVAQGRCASPVAYIAGRILSKKRLSHGPLCDWSSQIRLAEGVCEGCKEVLLERNKEQRRRIWVSLPQVFGIDVEGWPKADGENAAAGAA